MGAWFAVSLASSIGLVALNSDYVFSLVTEPEKSAFLFSIASSVPHFFGAMAFIALFTYMAKVGIDTYLEVRKDKDVGEFLGIYLYFGAVLIALYVFSLGYMYFVAESFKEDKSFGEFLIFVPLALIGIFFTLYVLIGGLFLTVIIPTFFIFYTPFMLLSVCGFFATGNTKATDIASKQVATRQPSEVIEKQLAEAMQSGLKSDIELNKIIQTMSPLDRFRHSLTYKRQAEKYREMRKIVDSQAEASRERNALGKSVHELERAKRDG